MAPIKKCWFCFFFFFFLIAINKEGNMQSYLNIHYKRNIKICFLNRNVKQDIALQLSLDPTRGTSCYNLHQVLVYRKNWTKIPWFLYAGSFLSVWSQGYWGESSDPVFWKLFPHVYPVMTNILLIFHYVTNHWKKTKNCFHPPEDRQRTDTSNRHGLVLFHASGHLMALNGGSTPCKS